ncbi:MAG: disulfide bond formation protein B [Alphaproteobacteria bacterium]|nr:MAG: disulfide bond formation protein B [Alphaproteobacteria bacterium]
MSRSRLALLLALAGSAGVLLGALVFQYGMGLAPCKLCIWQRWPHGIAVAIAVIALLAGWRWLALAGAAAMLVSAGLGFYHAGVEQGWFQGPDSCTSAPIEGMTTEQLMAQIMAAPLVRCDEIPWDLFGISIAGWNAVVSLILAGIWVAALWSGGGRRASG